MCFHQGRNQKTQVVKALKQLRNLAVDELADDFFDLVLTCRALGLPDGEGVTTVAGRECALLCEDQGDAQLEQPSALTGMSTSEVLRQCLGNLPRSSNVLGSTEDVREDHAGQSLQAGVQFVDREHRKERDVALIVPQHAGFREELE